MGKTKVKQWAAADYPDALSAVWGLYEKRVRDLEGYWLFDQFVSMTLTEAELKSKPMVMLVGQYSTGKTTFVKYLLGGDKVELPGAHVGPEPTTDGFAAVMHGGKPRLVPGNTASNDPNSPFRALTTFGSAFLSKFSVAETDSPILEDLTIVDTPGILAGEKQSMGRQYDFVRVCQWFAERSDMILLLFDSNKVDISDEFKDAIEALHVHDDKVRLVLNKSDSVTTDELMHVYGGVMWFLGKVFRTPEVKRSYISSFWDKPFANKEMARFMTAERDKLLKDLKDLPKGALNRKVNEFVKRIRLVRSHMLVLNYLRREVPLIGKQSATQRMVDELPLLWPRIAQQTGLPESDFPDAKQIQQKLRTGAYDFSAFPKENKAHLAALNDVIDRCIPHVLQHFSMELGLDTQSEVLSRTEMKGYLVKQSGSNRNKWQRRYFVMANRTLSYYGKQEDFAQAGKPKGMMALDRCAVDAAPEMEQSFCLKIATIERIYYVYADSMEEMSEWLWVLRRNTKALSANDMRTLSIADRTK